MNLHFDTSITEGYKSASQITRIITEDWLTRNLYCPVCGELSLIKAEANSPVKDHICKKCKSQYELKSKRANTDKFDTKVTDGEYKTIIDRITSLDNPSFFFLHYDNCQVNNLIIVPNCFIVPEIIEKRKPLADNARRAGWTGCNILVGKIPQFAKIAIIRDGNIIDPEFVCKEYNRVHSLQTSSLENRGWLFDVLKCIDNLNTTFSLKDLYKFTDLLRIKHPKNNHIEAKIRQQLQFLRDKGLIEFKGNGFYKKNI